MTLTRATARRSAAAVLTTALAATAAPVLTTDAAAAAPAVPRIVKAQLLDTDKDDRADSVVLTYSAPIKHALDTKGFPFVVKGYRITRIAKAANSRTLVITLAERATKDVTARPVVTYRATRKQPVLSAKGKRKAKPQRFTATRSYDLDGDGYAATDCRPTDRFVHPGAPDQPDLAFLDQDCDGIDGDTATAVFVDRESGDDANPGTRALPVSTLQGAYARASGATSGILVAGLSTGPDTTHAIPGGTALYGGYDPVTWQRSHIASRLIGTRFTSTGNVLLQLVDLQVSGAEPALKVLNGSASLQEVTLKNTGSSSNSVALVVTGGATVRAAGGLLQSGDAGDQVATAPAQPAQPQQSIDGFDGGGGLCDDPFLGFGGPGAGIAEGSGEAGGNGGAGGYQAGGSSGNGFVGEPGSHGAAGGTLGTAGNPGQAGGPGGPGAPGTTGTAGQVVPGTFAGTGYTPAASGNGTSGTRGKGGGGGGGGGGQVGAAVINGRGNGGGGGGEGGGGGTGGQGGTGGFASVAAYVPLGSLTLDGTQVQTGAGGNGRPGGQGALGGLPGAGGEGGNECLSEVGKGGKGGAGGVGGHGGAGAAGQGGPTIGVYTGPFAFYDGTDVAFSLGSAGTGPLPIRVDVY